MIKPEKSPKFFLKIRKITQKNLKISGVLRTPAEGDGLRLRWQRGFFQIFEARGILGWSPLFIPDLIKL